MRRLNHSELCREIGISKQRLSKHLGREDAPRPDADGRYDTKAVERYIGSRRTLDNNSTSAELLEERINNLRLENQLLKQKLRIDRPAYPPEVVDELLWHFMNEVHRETIGQLNGIAYALAESKTAAECLTLMLYALQLAEDSVARWCDDHHLKLGDLNTPWPMPHTAFAWWHKKQKG